MIKKSRHGARTALSLLILTALGASYANFALYRQLPPLVAKTASVHLNVASSPSKLNWPTAGQAAVAVAGSTILESHGTQKPVPIASVAKVITALVVLEKKPLLTTSSTPSFTLTEKDVAIYDDYVAKEGSVIPVSAGEQISEYQAIEAIMLPSANNIADSLAIWAFGSLANYQTAANSYLATHGLKQTRVGNDASGYSPTSTSTAEDLAKLGLLAMSHPVLSQIVAQETTTDIPGVAISKNVNFLLGVSNIVGIKTGNTDEAGGVYLSASRATIDGDPKTIITAYVGAPTLFQALKSSLPLITSAQANFSPNNLLTQGAVVGEYRQPWGGLVTAVTETNLVTNAWNGSKISASAKLNSIDVNAHLGQVVGSVISDQSSQDRADIILSTRPTMPSVWWRLMHPLR